MGRSWWLVGACLPALACAQPAGSGGEAAAQLAHSGHAQPLADVEVTGHYDNAVGTSDAASQGVVTSRLLESRPTLRPAEVLEFIPGMIVTQHSGDGKANQYFLRGFNLDHGTDFLTTVGGVPVNLPTHAHGHGYTDLNFLIPELVERIEYRKGPYYASTGDFSSSGAADIVLRRRVADPFVGITVGQDRYARLLGAASPTLANGASLLLAAEATANDGPWTLPQDLRRTNLLASYSAGTRADSFVVTAMSFRSDWNATDQVPLRAIESGLIGRFDAIDPTDGGRTGRDSLSAQWRRTLADGAVEVLAYAFRYELNLFSNFTYFLDRPETGDQFEQADRRTVAGGHLKRLWVGRLGDVPMSTEAGLQLRQDRIRVGLYDSQARERVDTVRDDRVTQGSVSGWVENSANWMPWLRTLAGLRSDWYRFDVRSNLEENSGQRSASLLSPKLSAVFGPWSRTELFANWGRGFHSNDARGVVARVDPRTGDPVDPVPGLVRTTGYEAGLRTEALPGLQTSLAAWRLDIGSELVFVGDAGTTEPSRPSRRQGLEWNNRYIPVRWLLFDLDVAWSRARFVDGDPAGDRVPGAAQWVASAAVAVRDLNGWSASLQLRYLGERPLTEDGSVMSSASTLLNARLAWRASKRVDLWLDVFNLTDRKVNDIEYYYESRLRAEPAAVADRHLHPVVPRTVRATVQVRL
jgi:hypothetical protein